MPILDNGEPLTINRCPECNSRRKILYQNANMSGQDCEVECRECGWEGDRKNLTKVKKPF